MTAFSLIVKGSKEDVKEACTRNNVQVFVMRPVSGNSYLVKGNGDFRTIVEWFCADSGKAAPFAAGSLLHYRNIS